MWIFDSYYKGCVELWSRERGLERISADYPPSFYMYLKDSHAHWEMIEGLESRYKVEECSFNTIFGSFQGHRIFASRKVAERIEKRTRYAAELYNVDIRQDQRYLAEKDLFPCGDRNESRFSPDFQVPLSILGMEVFGDPNLPREISCVQVLNGRKQRFEGPEKVVLADLLEFIKVHDPDVILLPYADTWVPLIVKKAKRYGLEPTFSRSNWFKSMTSKSYWSYGKVNHKDGAMIPESIISVGLFLIFELTGMRDFSINNGRSRLVEGVGPHSQ
jgi:DNA polymerase I